MSVLTNNMGYGAAESFEALLNKSGVRRFETRMRN
jgi:hypothetical protein